MTPPGRSDDEELLKKFFGIGHECDHPSHNDDIIVAGW